MSNAKFMFIKNWGDGKFGKLSVFLKKQTNIQTTTPQKTLLLLLFFFFN